MPNYPPRTLLLAAAAGVLGAGALRAQSSVAVTVSATVGTPVTISADAPLDFTQVFGGTPKTVDPVTGGAVGATAGRFSLLGKNNAEVLLMFTLPANLTSGGNALLIDSWQGCHNALDTTTGCTAFVPSAAGTVTRLSNGGGAGDKSLYIWVGATVRPTPAQPGGSYTGSIILTAVYNGF